MGSKGQEFNLGPGQKVHTVGFNLIVTVILLVIIFRSRNIFPGEVSLLVSGRGGGKSFSCNLGYELKKNDVVAFITSIIILFVQLHIILNTGERRDGQQTLLNVFISSQPSTKGSYLPSDRLVSHSVGPADSPLYNTEGEGANGSQYSEYQQLVM